MSHGPGELVLALEASTFAASAALVAASGAVAGHWQQAPGGRGTAALAAAVAELLRAQDLAPAALAGVAVGTGPGSYTGLRASIALARGLALGAGLPVLGVPSVAAAARAELVARPDAQHVIVLVDARRDEFYRADYARAADGGLDELQAPHLVPAAEAEAGAEHPGCVVLRDPGPLAADLGALGLARLASGGQRPDEVVPLYLKRSHAEIQLERR